MHPTASGSMDPRGSDALNHRDRQAAVSSTAGGAQPEIVLRVVPAPSVRSGPTNRAMTSPRR